jgi:hypothetical protein
VPSIRAAVSTACQAIWFGKYALRILGHDLFGCDKPQNRDLRKMAQEKLFLGGMHVTAPEQCEPNIRIASGKFNVFINMFAGQIYLGAFRDASY